jgi:hypothetical protein
MRDGTTTNRQDFTNPANGNLNEAARHNRKQGDVDEEEGYHESWEWYDECYRRERNQGWSREAPAELSASVLPRL